MATESTTSLWNTSVFESSTQFDYTVLGTTLVNVGMYILGGILLIAYGIAVFYSIVKVCDGEYWVWDTVSNHCQDGPAYYILNFVCSFAAIYLSVIYTIEFIFNAPNDFLTTIFYCADIISNLCLMGVGIVPTYYHFKMCKCSDYSDEEQQSYNKALAHLIFGLFFFIETCGSNLFWAIKYINLNSESWGYFIPVGISFALLIIFVALLLCVIPPIRVCINAGNYAKLNEEKHQKCLYNLTDKNCDLCKQRRLTGKWNCVCFFAELIYVALLLGCNVWMTKTCVEKPNKQGFC